MPSAANALSMGVAAPAASSASTRCMASSCAWRRAQNRADGGSPNAHIGVSGSVARSASASAPAPSTTQRMRSGPSGGSPAGRSVISVARDRTMSVTNGVPVRGE